MPVPQIYKGIRPQAHTGVRKLISSMRMKCLLFSKLLAVSKILPKNARQVEDFQKKYPTRKEKETALCKMSDEDFDKLIAANPNIYAKIFYKKFRKKPSQY